MSEHLKLTPLRLANIPPPMALHELALDQNAIDVAFSQSNTRLAVLHETSISVFDWDIESKVPKPPSLQFTIKTVLTPGTYNRQICFYGESDVLTLGSEHPGSVMYHYPDDDIARDSRISRLYTQNVCNITTSTDHLTLCIQCETGSSTEDLPFPDREPMHHTSHLKSNITIENIAFPVSCPWVEVIHYNDEVRI